MGKASNTIQVTHPNVRNHSASLYSDPYQKWKPSDENIYFNKKK